MSTHRVPPIRRHRSSGQAYVWLSGRRIYLGKYGLPETRAKYLRVVAEWLAVGQRPTPPPEDATVVELVAAFMEHAASYYRRPDGSRTSETNNFQQAVRPLVELYGSTPVVGFGPLRLRGVRQKMIDAKLARKTINNMVSRVRMVFRWGVEQEIVRPEVLHGLEAVRGLRRGRCEARESEPVRPVPIEHVTATYPHVSRQVRAMIELQLLTACRPGEVVAMRPIDIDASGRVWTYTPEVHKTAHHGHGRLVYIGPRGQRVLGPFLKGRPLEAYCFDPREAEATRRTAMHAARKTPLSCGNVPGSNKSKSPKRPPGERYSVDSYRRAIQRGCEQAGVPVWSPHRLKHVAATALRKEFGLDAARVILGHRSPAVTEVYAELDREKRIQIAGRVG